MHILRLDNSDYMYTGAGFSSLSLKINPYNAELFLYKPWRLKGFLNLKSSLMS